MNKIKTILIFRKRVSGFNSIEELFHGLHALIQNYCESTIVELPKAKLKWSTIRANLKFIKSRKTAVNHITGHVNYIALATGRNTVITIHDMKSAFTNSKLRNAIILIFLFWIPCWIARRITVISEATKNEVERHIPFVKSKIRVIYNPVHQVIKMAPKDFNATRPQILFMGTKPNKNLERTIEALSGFTCKLTIVGALSPNQKNLLEGSQINYKNVHDLSYDEVLEQYQNCDLLCFPSTYEGFGMPIIEAQATGRLVLTSDRGAMKEIAGDSAYLVDPYDSDSIRNGLVALCENEALRNELLSKSKANLKRFQSEEIAKQYVELYKELVGS